MKSQITSRFLKYSADRPKWPAIFSLFMGVTSLIAAEFIPVSLLTPIAQDLKITEGMAGQSVTVVGIFAVIASLTLAPLSKNINRRFILLTLSALMIFSNILVALTPNYVVLLIGRGVLGICVGGFWSMASAVTLQLASAKDVARALSVVYAGVSIATIISLPLASYLEDLMGWRNVFFFAALLSAIAFIWQYMTLPSLAAQMGNGFGNMLALLKQKWVLVGIVATIFSYGGYHIFFTYLRPFLEQDLVLQNNVLSISLLAFGIANCLGTLIAGFILGKFFRSTMIMMHLIFALLAILLLVSNRAIEPSLVLVIGWGLLFGFIPVGWSTWITKTLADKAEIIGALSVAAIQFAIGLAAAIGGIIFDRASIEGIFIASILIFVCAALFIKVSFSLLLKTTGKFA
ncbi:MFS transporter [Orbus sturtevantii]|uniref:MFS transporter n=1 Tax=Orbus sturtevantii TaxID=3074109 RepID=UPI00370DD150